MKKRMLLRAGIGAALAAMLTLTACSGNPDAASQESSASGGVLRYGVDSLPVTGGLDPVNGTQPLANRIVLAQMYETLLTVDDDGTLQPGIATDWDATDGKTFVFTIRDDVSFADGTPLTAEDVAYSVSLAAPGAPDQLAGFREARATDDGKVEVQFDEPNGAFLPIASAWSGMFIFSKDWYETTSEDERMRSANGSGAFAFESWEDGVKLILKKNEGYRDADKVKLDGIEWVQASDNSARLAMLQQGLVEAADISDPVIADQAKAAGFVPGASPALRNMNLMISAAGTPLENIDVRRAVSLAINREELIEVGMGGQGSLALPVPPGDPRKLDEEPADAPYYQYDLAEAKRLIAGSGYSDVTIDLTYAGDISAADVPMLEVLKEQLKQAGITLNLKAEAWSNITAIFGGAPAPSGLLLIPMIAQSDVSGYFAATSGSVLDFWGDNPDAQSARALVQQMIHEPDVDKRRALVQQATNEITDKVLLLIPASSVMGYEYLSPKVQGYTPDPFMGRINLKNASIEQ
ncbi:ABC transporter substrate-binding protein [Leucobacter sp. USHLN154]|uniref:ABC transporter substrate-binding protein n=1 Tax=Leucobacter sp. USHLN154 TaxID=3081269 RepID=UPI0030195C60